MKKVERAAMVGALVVLLLALWSTLLQQPLFFVAIRSGSMSPLLQTGDLALAVPAALHEPQRGDVVLFRSPVGLWIVHRIVGGDGEAGFYTRGDANPATDQEGSGIPRVALSSIVATVPAPNGLPLKLPLAGAISFFLQDYSGGQGPLPAIALLAAILLLAMPSSIRGSITAPGDWGSRTTLLAAVLAAFLTAFMAAQSTVIPLGDPDGGDPGPARAPGGPALPAPSSAFQPFLVKNGCWVPLLFSLSSGAPDLSPSPGWVLLWPGEQQQVILVPRDAGPATGSGLLREEVFLPLLPPPLIHQLAARSFWLAVALSAAAAVSPLLVADHLASRERAGPAK